MRTGLPFWRSPPPGRDRAGKHGSGFRYHSVLALLEMHLAAARDIQASPRRPLAILPASTALMSDAGGDAGRRIDVDAFQLVEQTCRALRAMALVGDEDLAAGGFQRIVKTAGDAVRRTAVRQHLGVDDLRIAARLVVVVMAACCANPPARRRTSARTARSATPSASSVILPKRPSSIRRMLASQAAMAPVPLPTAWK